MDTHGEIDWSDCPLVEVKREVRAAFLCRAAHECQSMRLLVISITV